MRSIHKFSDLPGHPLRLLTLACLAMLAGCVAPPPKVPSALDFGRSGDARTAGGIGEQPQLGPTKTVISQSPRPPAQIGGNLRPIAPKLNPSEEAGDLSVSFEQIALPAFIQAVYGGILKVNYSVDPAVSARTELITFRTPKPMSAARLIEVSAQLLRSYGVAVQDFGGVLRMVPDTNTASTLPLVRRGRAQPTVPLPLRPIFHYIETDAIRPQNFLPLLKTILGTKVTLEADPSGGLLVSGQPDDVAVALELIQVFDQPGVRAQNTTRVVPRYWGADEFARRLSEVLRYEGYGVGNQPNAGEPIAVYSVTPINSVVIFANSREVLAHVLDWVRELDQLPSVQAGNAYFTYPVKNADAQELARALNDLISGTTTPPAGAAAAPAPGGTTTASAVPARATSSGRRVVVNNATNSLIFQGGSQEDYRQWLSLLAQLDKPVKSALIDVLVAEVALSDNNDLGFVYRVDQLGSGATPVRLPGTTYTAGTGGTGFNLSAITGSTLLRQVAINALAANSDARVVSNPKVLTRNGESATISVGQDVPIVTSQAVAQTGGVFGNSNTTVPQTVQYRNTGVILRVRPIIHAGDRIDIEISQEVSSAEPTTTGVTSSPTIRKRSVDTKLSLRDGATVMLGGLISDNSTDSNSGVPFLKDIPGVGNLFKSQSRSGGRTELVMLITPYILNDSTDAESATDAFNATLGDWADGVRARVNAARDARDKRVQGIGLGAIGSPNPDDLSSTPGSSVVTRPLPPGVLSGSRPAMVPAGAAAAAAAQGLAEATNPATPAAAAAAAGVAAGTAPVARPGSTPVTPGGVVPGSRLRPMEPLPGSSGSGSNAAGAGAPPAEPVEAEPVSVLPVTRPQAPPRMVNFSNATAGAADSGAAPGVAGAEASGSNADAGQPVPLAPGRKEAPAVLDGFKVPSGATIVDDPKLKQEILDQLRKR